MKFFFTVLFILLCIYKIVNGDPIEENLGETQSLKSDDLERNQYRPPPPYQQRYNPYGGPNQRYNPYGNPNRDGNPYNNRPYGGYGGNQGGYGRGYGGWRTPPTTTTVGFPWNLFGKK